MTKQTLRKMFEALMDGPISDKRYASLLREFSQGEDLPVEAHAVKLMNGLGVMYLADGVIIEERVVSQ